MATSSSNILTKYTSGTTIVTADVANSWFGGLYGSYEATLLESDDPRIIGHQHDGLPYNGHSSKIDLVDHVSGKLQNQNLADEAVMVNNVASFVDQGVAIPESVVVDGVTYYYLDLSSVYTYIDDGINATPFESADTNADSADDAVRQSDANYSTTTGLDFVFGSEKLDDMASGTNGDNRFFFDKSKGVFRAGGVNSTQWDNPNRGNYSVAFGENNTVSGIGSFSAGQQNTVSSDYALVIGQSNTANALSHYSAILGRENATTAQNTFVSGYGASALVSGEVAHASGYFSVVGDAQSSEYTARGVSVTTTLSNAGITLTTDGVSGRYILGSNSAYAITVILIGKTSAPLVGAGFYKLEALGVGTTSSVLVPTISTPVITNISRTTYFTNDDGTGNVFVGVNVAASASGEIEIRVWDSTPALTFSTTHWTATVTLTKCKF
mgnify:CR=1 FL=1